MKGIKFKKRLRIYLIVILIILNSFISFAKKVDSLKQKLKLKKKTKKISIKNKANYHRKNINHNNNYYNNNKEAKNYSKLHKLEKPLRFNKAKSNEESNFVKFILGFGVGFGLKVDASEDLKRCFFEHKKKNSKIIKTFIFSETEKNNNSNILEKDKEKQKESAKSFTKTAMELFSRFKECNAFKETFLTFIKNKIISIGVKGVAYIIAGPLGLLLKGTYDVYKIITEISNFYKLKKQNPIDYYNLGSAVGKIIYYTQNILLKRKKKF